VIPPAQIVEWLEQLDDARGTLLALPFSAEASRAVERIDALADRLESLLKGVTQA
jgi:hypothetical protein